MLLDYLRASMEFLIAILKTNSLNIDGNIFLMGLLFSTGIMEFWAGISDWFITRSRTSKELWMDQKADQSALGSLGLRRQESYVKTGFYKQTSDAGEHNMMHINSFKIHINCISRLH